MEKIVWSDRFNTGVPVIDRQHWRIVEYLNRLCDANSNALPDDEIRPIFDDLVDYTLTHFTFEETLLANNYPHALRAHKQTHEVFSGRVSMLRHRFRDEHNATQELCRLLTIWLSDHIQHEDRRDITAPGQRLTHHA